MVRKCIGYFFLLFFISSIGWGWNLVEIYKVPDGLARLEAVLQKIEQPPLGEERWKSFDGERQTYMRLYYAYPQSVTEVTEFFRRTLPLSGWQETQFEKARKEGLQTQSPRPASLWAPSEDAYETRFVKSNIEFTLTKDDRKGTNGANGHLWKIELRFLPYLAAWNDAVQWDVLQQFIRSIEFSANGAGLIYIFMVLNGLFKKKKTS